MCMLKPYRTLKKEHINTTIKINETYNIKEYNNKKDKIKEQEEKYIDYSLY